MSRWQQVLSSISLDVNSIRNEYMNVLFVDHYDSFSHLLCDAIKRSMPEANITMRRCHDKKLLNTKYQKCHALVLSPGGMDARSSGYSPRLISRSNRPVLGVCLGMQIINEYLGGITGRSNAPVHGYPVKIESIEHPVFKSLPRPFWAARYNSLNVKCNLKSTSIIAWQQDFVTEVMGITDKKNRLLGLQFHPESFQTPNGDIILKNAFKFILTGTSKKCPLRGQSPLIWGYAPHCLEFSYLDCIF